MSSDCSDGPDFDTYDSYVNASECNCTNPRYWFVEVCNCDYPVAASPPLDEVLPPGIIYALVFILGAVGNLMVIYVVARYRRMRSVTNFFLASLSTADLLLLFFCVPLKYAKFLAYSWTVGSFFCWSLHYVQLFTMSCSVLTLTAISFERYIAIVYPIRSFWISSIGRAKRIVAILWLTSTVLAIPAALSQVHDKLPTKTNRTAYVCEKRFPSKQWEQAFALYQFVLLFLVPVATMTFCYTAVARILHLNQQGRCSADNFFLRTNSSRNTSCRLNSVSGQVGGIQAGEGGGRRQSVIEGSIQMSQQQRLLLRKSSRMPDQSLKQIIQMLILVVILFIICWTPYLVDDLLQAFGYYCESDRYSPKVKSMRVVFGVMAFSNSSINPIVYAFMSKNFRTTFIGACGGCGETDRASERRRFVAFQYAQPPQAPPGTPRLADRQDHEQKQIKRPPDISEKKAN